jgi:Tol biopolymer transport system component
MVMFRQLIGAKSLFHIRRVLPLTVLLVLSACSLNVGVPTRSALLPTRTAAPVRTVVAPTAEPNATQLPSPTRTGSATASSTPTRVSTYPACADVKLDLSTPKIGSTARGQIVYITLDGNVALTDSAGKNVTLVTTNANTLKENGALLIYTYPTFSADGTALAFVGYATQGDVITQTLYAAAPIASSKLVQLYSTTGFNIPYADWSPDGQYVAFLAINSQEGMLRVVNREGGASRVVEHGSSVYWHWRNNSQTLLAHLGGSPATDADAHHTIIEAVTGTTKRLSSVPGNYKAPQYSPNGRYILQVTRVGGNDDLVVTDGNGKALCSLATLDTGASFAWSPDGRRVAWIDSGSTSNLTAPLYVYDLAQSKQQQVRDSAIGFFWSPDSARMAVYSVAQAASQAPSGKASAKLNSPAAQNSTPLLRIEIIDAVTGDSVRVSDTRPTRGTVEMLSYFDQYARSFTPWSPSGDRLVFTDAREDGSTIDIVVAELSQAKDAVTLRHAVEGVIAFWSPR